MRGFLVASIFLLFAIATASPNLLADFIQPLLEGPVVEPNQTLAEGTLELLKRQTGCASGYNSCYGLGAPGLCCKSNAVCSADYAGHVACCPQGAACTGQIAGSVTASAVTTGSATTATSTVPYVLASTTTGGVQNSVSIGTATGTAFVQQSTGTSYIRSTPLIVQLMGAALRHSQTAFRALQSLR